MTLPVFEQHDEHLHAIQTAIHQAADPVLAVERALTSDAAGLVVNGKRYPLNPDASVYLVAFGKASCGMASAAAERLGHRLTAGVASIPAGARFSLSGIESYHGGHPLPTEGSLAAGRAVARLLERTRRGDLVLVLISGGGSAMLEWPLEGIRLEDLQALTQLLLHSGAPIEDINVVRKAISQIKAGGVARLAAPAQVVALILSDVVGDRLSAIASGTTVLRRVPAEDACQVLARYNILQKVPDRIRTALEAAPVHRTSARRPGNHLVGSNRLALEAASAQARALGFHPRVINTRMHGEARLVAEGFARRLARTEPGTCLLMGGETTVTIRGDGKGGRNQEFALAASMVLPDAPRTAIMSLATDGVDGPTDAAGAVVTSELRERAEAAGLNLADALAANNSYPALKRLGGLIQTGPSGTNVNDIVIGLVYD